MLYFAYGSNMNWDQMRDRCPSARYVGNAVLPDHALAFTRKSVNRGCGVSDAVPAEGYELWGVVYEIDDGEVKSLDKSEGYRPGRDANSYFRRECLVLLAAAEEPVTVFTYFGDPQPHPPLPDAEYKALILSGARSWHLPEQHIRTLEQIQVDG